MFERGMPTFDKKLFCAHTVIRIARIIFIVDTTGLVIPIEIVSVTDKKKLNQCADQRCKILPKQ